MKRRMYRAQLKERTKEKFVLALEESLSEWRQELQRQGMLAGSLFEKGDSLFLYFETAGESFKWEWPAACRAMLETWPGGSDGTSRLVVPMLDIYHDGEGESPEARCEDRERIGSLARLKPEMYGSYIFYHYAKQEETPNSFNPTYMIGAHEEVIFSYHERPVSASASGVTRRTWPAPITPDNWHDLMRPHFIPWTDGEQGAELWVKMNALLTL
ncbi:hypothetical protein [Paenibacillus contaminans]|uniref:Uncharacterized protein n=1 Tax=Paenibacillus contaminans TaxID=450362 RepID=A0A329MJI0_9BACL|nr:hypothetical protein [Paenibacillus contaminans]RAV20111.1 hypothetical protein DQG23_16715 [Paenibacillus contaminans]